MPYDVLIKDEPDELVASIRRRVNFAKVGDTIPDGFRRLWECVEPVGHGEGMPGMVIYQMDGGVADIEMFVPVARPFDPSDEITVTTLPGGRMATTTHVGPYDGSGAAYAALGEWITEHGHHVVGPPREYYLNDPQVVGMDKAETEIEFPIDQA